MRAVDARGRTSGHSARALATVTGVPAEDLAQLSVADAEATEGANTHITFTVTLDPAASGPVTVDYATKDGSATSPADYAARSDTLTFAPGETSRTVSVQIVDDGHDDDGETFTLELSNATGAAIADGVATGTIRNADPMPAGWLARFGRTGAVHVMDMLGARFEAAARQDNRLVLGGRPVDVKALRATLDDPARLYRVESGETMDTMGRPADGASDNVPVTGYPPIPGGYDGELADGASGADTARGQSAPALIPSIGSPVEMEGIRVKFPANSYADPGCRGTRRTRRRRLRPVPATAGIR